MSKRKPTTGKARRPSAAAVAKVSGNGGGPLAVQARYDAAGQGRRMRGWNAPSTGPNRAIAGLPTIRNRARDAARNEWQGASSVRAWTVGMIGVGITPRPRTKLKAVKAKLAELWAEWVKVADADGVLDFYGLQALLVRCWLNAGEVFVRIRPRRLSDGLPVPMQVQLIEPELVPHFDADQWPGMKAGNKIRQGVEFDRINRRVAYWMYKEHPGDSSGAGVMMQDLVRVPADQVRHVFEPLRPGQIRGVPDLAPVLARLRNTGDMDDNVLERQKLANLFAMFITRAAPTGAEQEIDPLSGKTIQYAADGGPIAALEPGISQELLPGEDVKFSDPPDAGANYADFMRHQNLGVAAGDGLPYEILTGDIRDVSDRTLRVVINEWRRYMEQRQWHVVIPMFCQYVRDAWADAAFLAGVLTEQEAKAARDTEWAPHRWAYIHPVQDVQAETKEIEAGLASRGGAIAKRGDDPEQVDEERAADQKRELALGLRKEEPDPAADPVKQAEANKANAEAAKANAQAEQARAHTDAILAQRDASVQDSAASAQRHLAEAERARADAAMLTARANLAEAEAALVNARAANEQAEHAARLADIEAASARENHESAARVSALEQAAADASMEADARMEALNRAEDFAREQRELVLAAERIRADAAALELQAAQLGLEELRGE